MPINSFLEIFNKTIMSPFELVNKETSTEWDFCVNENNQLVIRFKGSTSKLDFLQNAFFLKKSYRKGSFKIHRGFFIKYKSIQNDLFRIIKNNNFDEIILLGYSQGAAIAILAHEDIWYHFNELKNKIKTYTFGCPKVVSWSAPTKRWSSVTRVENGNDLVPKLPFEIMNYKHIGNTIHIGEKSKWWKFSVKQHLPNSYRKGLLVI